MKYAILLLILAFASSTAVAEPPQYRHWSVNAPAMCHPALLRFDSDVRKRPLAVVNEGASSAFVTCSLPVNLANDNGVESFYAVLRNLSGSSRTVKCTAVYGVDDGGALYVVRNVSVLPGQRLRIELDADDFELDRLHNRVGISCLLPAMVGINEVGTEEKL